MGEITVGREEAAEIRSGVTAALDTLEDMGHDRVAVAASMTGIALSTIFARRGRAYAEEIIASVRRAMGEHGDLPAGSA